MLIASLIIMRLSEFLRWLVLSLALTHGLFFSVRAQDPQRHDSIADGMKSLGRKFNLDVRSVDREKVGRPISSSENFFHRYKNTDNTNENFLIPHSDSSGGSLGAGDIKSTINPDGSMSAAAYFTLRQKLQALTRLRKFGGPKVNGLVEITEGGHLKSVAISIEAIAGRKPLYADVNHGFVDLLRKMQKKKWVIVDAHPKNWILTSDGQFRPVGLYLFSKRELKADNSAVDYFRHTGILHSQAALGKILHLPRAQKKGWYKQCQKILLKLQRQATKISLHHH